MASIMLFLAALGKLIYHLMFSTASLVSDLISCRKYILRGKKGVVVYPSQLDPFGLKNLKFKKLKTLNYYMLEE